MYAVLENRRFEYQGYHGKRSACGLLILEPKNPLHPYYAVATELEDNPGTSVTNVAERLATEVFRYLERPKGGLAWIEHYPDRYPVAKESFKIVQFDMEGGKFVRPRWKTTSREVIRYMTGVQLV